MNDQYKSFFEDSLLKTDPELHKDISDEEQKKIMDEIRKFRLTKQPFGKTTGSFFKNPSPVDKLLFKKFYKYILENSQINGNFDGYFPFKNVFILKF